MRHCSASAGAMASPADTASRRPRAIACGAALVQQRAVERGNAEEHGRAIARGRRRHIVDRRPFPLQDHGRAAGKSGEQAVGQRIREEEARRREQAIGGVDAEHLDAATRHGRDDAMRMHDGFRQPGRPRRVKPERGHLRGTASRPPRRRQHPRASATRCATPPSPRLQVQAPHPRPATPRTLPPRRGHPGRPARAWDSMPRRPRRRRSRRETPQPRRHRRPARPRRARRDSHPSPARRRRPARPLAAIRA